MKLGEMSWTEFEEAGPEVALLPAGSTEQHGPHCPLCTDSLIAEKIAERAAEDTGTLLLPSMKVGVSREHSSFPGTLYLSPETFRRQLKEEILSANESGVEKFVVVNGHGGNVSSIREVCQDLYHDLNILALEWTWFNAISAKEMGHAGKLETSLVLYLQEELVGNEGREGADSWGRSLGGTRIDYDTSLFTEDGVVGDPTGATEEKGKEIFKETTEKLSELAMNLKDGEFEDYSSDSIK